MYPILKALLIVKSAAISTSSPIYFALTLESKL